VASVPETLRFAAADGSRIATSGVGTAPLVDFRMATGAVGADLMKGSREAAGPVGGALAVRLNEAAKLVCCASVRRTCLQVLGAMMAGTVVDGAEVSGGASEGICPGGRGHLVLTIALSLSGRCSSASLQIFRIAKVVVLVFVARVIMGLLAVSFGKACQSS
jgi:hypothetical protein